MDGRQQLVATGNEEPTVERLTPSLIYLALMVALIVSVDVLFFRDRFWERLIANIGIVAVFATFSLRFLWGHGRP